MAEKFCNYCRRFRVDDGKFKTLHQGFGKGGVPTPRRMCSGCQATRMRPRAELIKLAEREREERKPIRLKGKE